MVVVGIIAVLTAIVGASIWRAHELADYGKTNSYCIYIYTNYESYSALLGT
jgi:hypothetical protein